MPHQSFGTVRHSVERDPISFDFGLYDEQRFVVMAEPSFGDVLDLYDAPEPTPDNEGETVIVLTRFITRMLVIEDRQRFVDTLHRIPASEAPAILIGCATFIAEQVTGFPTSPPTTSSGGRPTSGTPSKPKRAGLSRSSR